MNRPIAFCIAVVVAMLAVRSPAASAQLTPERLYVGIDQPLTVDIARPDTVAGALAISLHDLKTGAVLERVPCEPGPVDLAALFPTIWSLPEPIALAAQLSAGNLPVGPPLIIQPLVTPDTATLIDPATLTVAGADGLPVFESTARRLRAARTGIPATPRAVTHSGARVYADQLAVLRTDVGDLTFRLRPDEAPNTAFTFRHLVEGGMYTGVPVHRVVDRLGDGSRFVVQTGDPTGTGLGGPGFRVDMEPSELAHDYGVLSLARGPDPNSGGSQVFICLSREGTAALDGRYTAFGELVDGRDTLERIAATPVDQDDRPRNPITITDAFLIGAPPITERPRRVADPRLSAPETGRSGAPER